MIIGGKIIPLPDGRTLTHHRITDVSLDAGSHVVTITVGSWEVAEHDAAGARPALNTFLEMRYGDGAWEPEYYDGLTEAVASHPEWTDVEARPSLRHYWNPLAQEWGMLNPPLEQAKSDKWQAMKLARRNEELAPFTFNGATYDANKEQITGAAQMALIANVSNAAFSIEWTLRDNTTKTHTANEMIAVGVHLGTRISAIYDYGRILRDRINAATTVEELDTIAWGWPEA